MPTDRYLGLEESSLPADQSEAFISSLTQLIRATELSELDPVRRICGRNWTKADILVYRLDGVEIAVKDYGARPWLIRQLLGRLLIRRETAAYRAATGLPGVPPFLGRLGPFALATLWIEAVPLAQIEAGSVGPAHLDRLAVILDALHDSGIALADLHHRDVLISRDGSVHVVDLAMAWVARPGGAIFERLREADLVALARMRARVAGQSPEQAILDVGARAARHHHRGRRLKQWLGHNTDAKTGDGTRGYNRLTGVLRIVSTFVLLGLILGLARPTPLGVTFGFLIAAGGEALRFWAAGHLHKTVELITSGPYRFTRNPLFLGRLLIFTGMCVMATLPFHLHWVVLALGYLVFFGYYIRRKERVEPARLRAVHGDRYDRYHAAIPALFPTLMPYADAATSGWSSRRMLLNREHWMVIGLLAASLFLLWRAYQPVI
jgi:protein-S-isoprenylcysteine O-methyltransferase Ste14